MTDTTRSEHADADDRAARQDPRPGASRDGGPDLRTAEEQSAAGQSAYNRPPSSTDPGADEFAGTGADGGDPRPPADEEGRQQPSRP